MKVDQKGHTTILKETKGDLNAFVENIMNQYNSFVSQNLVLDISHDKTLKEVDLHLFKDLLKKHTKAKKSLVIVADGIDFNDVSDDFVVVPSLLEAQDIIEMDEIERDLGF